MPYKAVHVSKDRVCVYKKNPDGSTGERVGCTTPSKINDYLAALHIHENDKGKGGKK
jgi:hypothetical protein